MVMEHFSVIHNPKDFQTNKLHTKSHDNWAVYLVTAEGFVWAYNHDYMGKHLMAICHTLTDVVNCLCSDCPIGTRLADPR